MIEENIVIDNQKDFIMASVIFAVTIIGFTIAASLLLFFGLNNFNSQKDQLDMQTVSITEIESWLDDDLISFSDYDIAETFSDTELSYHEYENDEITDYLNFVDIENLILEN